MNKFAKIMFKMFLVITGAYFLIKAAYILIRALVWFLTAATIVAATVYGLYQGIKITWKNRKRIKGWIFS